ncbi:hypothetical protein EIP91_004051 [Steccherinum ochraceum]|uniref:Uncharacterized protein n=1 Tax=Steccherinum ochraceum TaxID=92696 RepID=A0A4V2MW15_9APHY|nr:hypothetical protein EIP91_004051 [Steccherinum ochraceum]
MRLTTALATLVVVASTSVLAAPVGVTAPCVDALDVRGTDSNTMEWRDDVDPANTQPAGGEEQEQAITSDEVPPRNAESSEPELHGEATCQGTELTSDAQSTEDEEDTLDPPQSFSDLNVDLARIRLPPRPPSPSPAVVNTQPGFATNPIFWWMYGLRPGGDQGSNNSTSASLAVDVADPEPGSSGVLGTSLDSEMSVE